MDERGNLEAPVAADQAQGSPPSAILSETSILIENYKIIADWIRFADGKAAVLLGVQGVLLGQFVPLSAAYYGRVVAGEITSKPWLTLVLGSDVLWFGFFLASTFMAVRCIVPHSIKGRHQALGRCNHFHPAAISSCYRMEDEARFVAGYVGLGTEGFKREVLLGIFTDSFI
ncbi:MAG: hypothetical protein LC745_03315 [Planctomycetia bacterium]|nr:hypothetical protein [Planctomycetia bacterium]